MKELTLNDGSKMVLVKVPEEPGQLELDYGQPKMDNSNVIYLVRYWNQSRHTVCKIGILSEIGYHELLGSFDSLTDSIDFRVREEWLPPLNLKRSETSTMSPKEMLEPPFIKLLHSHITEPGRYAVLIHHSPTVTK